MAIGRLGFLFAVLTTGLSAQTAAPAFTRDSVLPVWGKHSQSLMPNELVAIYGRHLAPAAACGPAPPPTGGIYPTELCGTKVTVGGVPAGLLAVLETQINLQVPAGVPTSGEAAIVVTVRGVSSRAVMVPFGKPKVILSVADAAYVHMPVWIALEQPYPYDVSYPYSLTPWNFGGGKFEVKRNGVILKPVEYHRNEPMRNGLVNGSIAPADSPRGRFPLHLQYRFDVPGTYEVRFVGTRMETVPGRGMQQVQVNESDWTKIDVMPYLDAQRELWIQEQVAKMPSSPGLLVGDAIPSLLALPDQLALRAILPQLYHASDLVRRYVAASLAMFDEALLKKELSRLVRAKGPTEELARFFDGDGFEGGRQAFLAILPPFLNSASPLAQSGALQYLVWAQNHDWGKTQEFQKQLSALVLPAVPNILEHGDAHSQQMLAEALGSLKSTASRDLLWKMIENGMAEEQSMIALTWIGDSRDLPRLAGLLTKTDPADEHGYKYSSLPYSLHRAYGDASLPWLKRAARDTKEIWVRASCAKELVLADQKEGFQYMLQALDEMPSFQSEAVQFLRDRFPDLRSAPEPSVLEFLKGKARAQ